MMTTVTAVTPYFLVFGFRRVCVESDFRAGTNDFFATFNRELTKKIGILLSLVSWSHTSTLMKIKHYFRYGLGTAGECWHTYSKICERGRACCSVIYVRRKWQVRGQGLLSMGSAE